MRSLVLVECGDLKDEGSEQVELKDSMQGEMKQIETLCERIDENAGDYTEVKGVTMKSTRRNTQDERHSNDGCLVNETRETDSMESQMVICRWNKCLAHSNNDPYEGRARLDAHGLTRTA